MRFFSAVNSPRVNDHPTFLMRVCCITQRAQRNGSFALPLSSCYEAWLDKYTKCLQFVLEFFPMSISGGLLMLNFWLAIVAVLRFCHPYCWLFVPQSRLRGCLSQVDWGMSLPCRCCWRLFFWIVPSRGVGVLLTSSVICLGCILSGSAWLKKPILRGARSCFGVLSMLILRSLVPNAR